MRNKKHPEVDLERKKSSFFLTGLIIAIGGAIAVLNLEWSQKEIIPYAGDLGEELAVEIMPTVTREAPKVRKPIAVISDIIVIKETIEAAKETPEIKLADLSDPLDGEYDPDADIDDVEEIPSLDDAIEEVVPYVLVERFPTFFDCGEVNGREAQKKCFEQGILKHISSNFKYPIIEQQMGLEEKVYVEFIITKKGEVDQVKIVRGNMKGFINESKRLVSSIPKVKPAEQRGKPVNMKYTIPIKFSLK